MTTDPLPSGNPYVGPRPFEEADARDGRYYGREREARDLLALVARERLVLFYAQSGAGKSSLLRASLIPGLRDLGFDVLPIARVSGAAPGAAGPGVANIFVYDLILSVNEGLPVEDRAPAEALAKATLAEFLGGEAAGDPDAAARLAPTVLLVDQFEEIVTSRPERWQDRAAFFEQLRDALERLPRLWVVLTLREDFVAPLEPYAELLPNRLRARYYMQRMGQNAALEAVRQPAATYGLPFAAGVAETLVDNLRRVRVQFRAEPQLGEYVEPVQLQVVCYELWQKLHPLPNASPAGSAEQQVPPSPDEAAGGEAEERVITEADLPLGHIDQALTHFYEDALAEVLEDPAAQAAGTDERRLRAWFDKELITAEGIRNAVARNEQTGRTGSLANAAVDRLARRYLVRTELRAGGAWVELVHDRFVEPIRASNAAWFPQHLSALQRQAAFWAEQGRSPGLLLRDAPFAEAEAWAAANQEAMEPHEEQFLDACRATQAATERERRQSRRIRILAAVAGTVAVLAIIAAGLAGGQMLRAQRAEKQARDAKTVAEEKTRLAKVQTEVAKMLLEVEEDFLAQLENRRLTVNMLKGQRQRLEQGASLLDSGDAPQKVILPDLTGKHQVDAQALLDKACEQQPQPCLRSQVRWETNDARPSGWILRTEPSAGAELSWGATVTVTASQGEPKTINQPIAMELVPVPAGNFWMGSDAWADPGAEPDEQPQSQVYLPEFYIGKHEVTNTQYAAFVEATGNRTPDDWENGRVPPYKDDHPVAYVTWSDAVAFTQWLSKESGMTFRLCTEAEWEKACRGTTGLIHPWGDTFDATKANADKSNDETMRVGRYSPMGDSPYGAADMVGNVWEWTSTMYAGYPYDPADGRENGTDWKNSVIRGGSFVNDDWYARCAGRYGSTDDRNYYSGFRVCMSPRS